jgi:hypothetical protein
MSRSARPFADDAAHVNDDTLGAFMSRGPVTAGIAVLAVANAGLSSLWADAAAVAGVV